MAKFRDILFSIITKLEIVDYVLVIILWVAGTVATILGFPWINLGIVVLHFFEACTIGVKTGVKAGEKLIYSIVMCMTFGFTWWVPVMYRMEKGE